MTLARAVFLDRDGVLTRERADYVKKADELEILPEVYEPLRRLEKMGFRLVLVTNQSVVGRGFATHDGLARIHEKLQQELGRHGCHLDAIYYCPHLPQDGCRCRKPEPGMIERAVRELGIDVTKSWLIGDKDVDLEAARRAGCRGLMVSTNSGELGGAVQQIIDVETEQEEFGP